MNDAPNPKVARTASTSAKCQQQTFIRSLPLYRPSFTPMERRNWLLSVSISSWTSWTSGNAQNHAVPNTSCGLSNSNPGRVGEVALAREVVTSRRNSLFIVALASC